MSPYNLTDRAKSGNSHRGAETVKSRQRRERTPLAEMLVREWTPEQRARIRADPLTTPELAALIDQAGRA